MRLGDYLEALEKLVELDQSAYRRSIGFGFPTTAEAEREFNLVMRNTYEYRGTAPWPRALSLGIVPEGGV